LMRAIVRLAKVGDPQQTLPPGDSRSTTAAKP
jgi:hypothetical protein